MQGLRPRKASLFEAVAVVIMGAIAGILPGGLVSLGCGPELGTGISNAVGGGGSGDARSGAGGGSAGSAMSGGDDGHATGGSVGAVGTGGVSTGSGGQGGGGGKGSGAAGGTAGAGGLASTGGMSGMGGTRGMGGMGAHDAGTGTTFTALYGTIFGTATCAGTLCHDPGIQKGVDLSTRANAYSSLNFEVVPGDGAGSALYRLLSNGTMPPDPAPKLTTTQLVALRAWIDGGALDD
jgi:hypothetical protein